MKPDLETLKAWCHYRRKQLERCNDFVDPDSELELVKAVEDTISRAGTWKAKFEKADARVKELEAEKEVWGNEFSAVVAMKDLLLDAQKMLSRLLALEKIASNCHCKDRISR